MWKIWIDTGGTFTDCLAISPDLKIKRLKILSSGVLRGKIKTQISPSIIRVDTSWPAKNDVFEGYKFHQLNTQTSTTIKSIDLIKNEITLTNPVEIGKGENFEVTANEQVPILACRLLTNTKLTNPLPEIDLRLGSTKGTNALLERKGAKVAFLVTKGFKDILQIGTQQRPNIFALNINTPNQLYHEVIEIEERISADGSILKPLNDKQLDEQIAKIKSQNLSVAIAFINSYKNNTHEKLVSEKLRLANIEHVSVSSELSSAIKILPRAQTTVVNAYLQPIMSTYIAGIVAKLNHGSLRIMTSAGAVVENSAFTPKDSLLSGPAGGIIGAAAIGKSINQHNLVTFDMGGTSTDVSIYDRAINYTYETKVGDAHIQSPAIHIETIAAGGGSICYYNNGLLQVGPESAGASPGPACYGNGGPLTITDINLLAGRLSENQFAIPINRQYSEAEFKKLVKEIEANDNNVVDQEQLLKSILNIANEKMAAAIKNVAAKKGTDIKNFALMSFGGAGGQHACDLAEVLQINKIIIPYDAGLLSAFGIGMADIDNIQELLILRDLKSFEKTIEQSWQVLINKAKASLTNQGFDIKDIIVKHKFLLLRLQGQEATIEIDIENNSQNILSRFKEAYLSLFGHWVDNRKVEVESIKLVTSIPSKHYESTTFKLNSHKTAKRQQEGENVKTKVFKWELLSPNKVIKGPAIIASDNCTVYLKDYWQFELNESNNAVLTIKDKTLMVQTDTPKSVEKTLFLNRFKSIVEQMGAVLERTSFSVNVKERLDFSCALLDSQGYLVVNAPHIPVHLGSLGVCVRAVINKMKLGEGDIVITNHPGYGGSHLPDITLISPIYYQQKIVGYVANRAHHAEIGGKTPGSMPTDAKTLAEEGVIIKPQLLISAGTEHFDRLAKLFLSGPFPTRSIQENLADLRGAVASINTGIQGILKLCEEFSYQEIEDNMAQLKTHSGNLLLNKLAIMPAGIMNAQEKLDDGSELAVTIDITNKGITFDFTGSSMIHPFNLNATEAIVNSVILYVLRLLVNDDIPLNEGLMDNVKIILPEGLLNPNFDIDNPPAVVGGNTEISQRLTDTILKCFKMVACSQGTMNNLLFGNDKFGYYETICGGTGAGPDFNGHDAIHQHMTNTRITDPEIIEFRYPVRLDKFEIRVNSGGDGQYKGGNGVIREFTFLEKLKLTLLTQHRKSGPYGMNGGTAGTIGSQYIIRNNGAKEAFKGIDQTDVYDGDKLVIETPGGGGYGSIK